VIARLSGSEQIQASIASAQFELLSAQQELTDLEANAELALAQAQLKVAEAEKALDKATKKRASRNYKYGNQEQIDIAWADYVVAQETVKHAEEAYNGVAYQANDNPTKAGALSALAAARQARDRALANYNYLLALPNELEVNEADAQLMLAQAELNAAQEELQRVENGADAQKVELAQARIVNAQAQLAAAEARLAEVELEAPFTGTLVSSSLKVGELVSPGSPEVVLGNLSQWQVETLDLTEINVVGIQPEMPVVVQIDALPELELTGKVVRVKERGENRQGDIVYAVLIALDEQDERLRWNMTASVRFGE
jgi:HlyD family secretion protein